MHVVLCFDRVSAYVDDGLLRVGFCGHGLGCSQLLNSHGLILR